MSILFISDLHLQASRPDITRAFVLFLQQRASKAEALYILGDFFEAWIGDDYRDSLTDEISAALKDLASKGVAIYIQHGNRDFLLGSQFCAACDATLLPEQVIITPYGYPVLLMHGDTLCTRDSDYQAFRQVVRASAWQADFLSKTLTQRLEIARQLRQQSQTDAAMKDNSIMDVTADEVSKQLCDYGVPLLIHGHTHRPALHSEQTSHHQPALRAVLGDWDQQGWYLQLSTHNLQLVPFSIAAPDFDQAEHGDSVLSSSTLFCSSDC